jgi:hypothetical protein
MSLTQAFRLAQRQGFSGDLLDELRSRANQIRKPHFRSVVEDPRDLTQTGWGILFPSDVNLAIPEALSPLIQHRRAQAGEIFKLFAGKDGVRPGESKDEFLKRFGVGPGACDPDKVPYYLLIVADPNFISYRFQYQLDVLYSVGRLHFDTPQEYADYAQSVIQSESGRLVPPRAVFFGVSNPDDRATALSFKNLVRPLVEKLSSKSAEWTVQSPKGIFPAWEIQTFFREDATKANLVSLLGDTQAPTLLFSAGHGLAFPNGDPRQLVHQGALVCQDWPGPVNWRGPIPEDFYFSASDLRNTDDLLGMIAFIFASFSAGAPRTDELAPLIWSNQPQRQIIAPHDFVAGLPRRMLGLPKGGALAVVGHCERAWGLSFDWGDADLHLPAFQDCFARLMMSGYPLGYALEVFNNLYAELASDLSSELEDNLAFHNPGDRELVQMWTAKNDARNYILLGDPAVRLNAQVMPGDGGIDNIPAPHF